MNKRNQQQIAKLVRRAYREAERAMFEQAKQRKRLQEREKALRHQAFLDRDPNTKRELSPRAVLAIRAEMLSYLNK